MALESNIPLSVQNANPLGAIFESRGIQARTLQNQQQAQNIDKQAQEMEKRSLIDGAVQLNEYLKSDNPDTVGATRFLEGRIKSIQARGGNAQQSIDALTRLKNGEVDAVKSDLQGILALNQLQSDSAAWNEFQQTTKAAGLEPGSEGYMNAAKIKLGINPRAVGGASKTVDIGGVPYTFDPTTKNYVPVSIGGKEVTSETVAETESKIAEGKKFGQMTGDQRAEAIQTAVTEIGKLEANISNLDEAYAELEAGAESGPLVSKWTPTLREETQRLEQVRNKLGLDVVGAVTFGALSQGELDIALATAMPNLPPPALKKWIRDRQEAQRKLIDFHDAAIDHLARGGTIASFRQEMRKKKGGGQQGGSSIDLGDGFSVELEK